MLVGYSVVVVASQQTVSHTSPFRLYAEHVEHGRKYVYLIDSALIEPFGVDTSIGYDKRQIVGAAFSVQTAFLGFVVRTNYDNRIVVNLGLLKIVDISPNLHICIIASIQIVAKLVRVVAWIVEQRLVFCRT